MSRAQRIAPWVRVLLVLWAGALATSACQVTLVRFADPLWTVPMIQQAMHRRAATDTFDWPEQAWRDLEDLGPDVPVAVVSSEDQRFWEHHGFDTHAIHEAVAWNEAHPDRRRGASTISQQVARNLFLWTGGGWLRKGLEAWYTLLLELIVPKERILELYLNVAETGPTTFGFEAGARYWYGKPAAELSPTEAATLAAILPSPRKWPATGPYASERAEWILANPPPGHRTSEPDIPESVRVR